jgi:hypothetical protein
MNTDKFDELARAVAAGAPRRQLITGLLGAAGGLFGLAGLRRGGDSAAAADTQKVYLPLIRTGTGICPIPSTCEEKQYCSDNRDCICVRTPEGGIRCGQIPSCSAQKCKTSADCANLGADYFCDTVGSGCCDDEQRCLAPCGAPQPACPDHRICGATCCDAGEMCTNGACVGIGNGTWTGNVTYNGQTIGIRFVLSDDAGSLEGRLLMADPQTGQYLETGEVTGSRFEDQALWTTGLGSDVEGTFNAFSFSGTMTFPQVDDDPGFQATIALTRTGGAAGGAAIPFY